MRIGEVAKRTGLNISNVRFYERKGLLAPAREEENNYREYSEEDVFRIKEILVYRKMGISVDTIYLLLNNQIGREEILERQKRELKEQLSNLQGTIELCDIVLQDQKMDEIHMDQYLEYVHQEEEKGKQFSEVAELMEDFTEYTIEGVFYWSPVFVWLFQRPRVAAAISVGFFGILLAVPVNRIWNVCVGRSQVNVHFFEFLIMYAMILGCYLYGFMKYRKAKKRYEREKHGK